MTAWKQVVLFVGADVDHKGDILRRDPRIVQERIALGGCSITHNCLVVVSRLGEEVEKTAAAPLDLLNEPFVRFQAVQPGRSLRHPDLGETWSFGMVGSVRSASKHP